MKVLAVLSEELAGLGSPKGRISGEGFLWDPGELATGLGNLKSQIGEGFLGDPEELAKGLATDPPGIPRGPMGHPWAHGAIPIPPIAPRVGGREG